MTEFIEEEKVVEIPQGTGVRGFLKALQSVLELSRIQRVEIVPGRLTYWRLKRANEPERDLGIDLESVMPSAVIRNSEASELEPIADNAAASLARMFAQASNEGYYPTAFVTGTSSKFWEWHSKTTSVLLRREEAYGLPFYRDPKVPDSALILCAAHTRRASMVDVVRCYKITLPFPE